MNAPPTATTRDGAFLALALADALKLGLPDPDYITVSPHFAGSKLTSAVSFQFNDHHGRDPLPAMQAWADRFGVTVNVSAGRQPSTWHRFGFTHAGVLFDAYAEIKADAPEAAAPDACAECGELVCNCGDDMGEDATDSIAEDAYCSASVQDSFGNLRGCGREDGHGGSHHAEPDGDDLPGIAWSDPGPVTGRDVLLSALADGGAA